MSATGRFKRTNVASIASAVAEEPAPSEIPNDSNPPALPSPNKTQRARGDFYETPTWAIDAILAHLPLEGEPVIVDAGSGTGIIAARLAAINPRSEIVGVEKFPDLVERSRARGVECAEFVQGNFLRWSPDLARPDLVVMNPPFSFAMHFVTHALEIVKRGGTVCALLRLNWLASKARREFHKKHPSDVFVLTKRPSFTGGSTDATDYAWFVWGPDRGNRWQLITHDDKAKRRPARAARKTSPTPET